MEMSNDSLFAALEACASSTSASPASSATTRCSPAVRAAIVEAIGAAAIVEAIRALSAHRRSSGSRLHLIFPLEEAAARASALFRTAKELTPFVWTVLRAECVSDRRDASKRRG
jgi:stage V sporulation protein SpoVS